MGSKEAPLRGGGRGVPPGRPLSVARPGHARVQGAPFGHTHTPPQHRTPRFPSFCRLERATDPHCYGNITFCRRTAKPHPPRQCGSCFAGRGWCFGSGKNLAWALLRRGEVFPLPKRVRLRCPTRPARTKSPKTHGTQVSSAWEMVAGMAGDTTEAPSVVPLATSLKF